MDLSDLSSTVEDELIGFEKLITYENIKSMWIPLFIYAYTLVFEPDHWNHGFLYDV